MTEHDAARLHAAFDFLKMPQHERQQALRLNAETRGATVAVDCLAAADSGCQDWAFQMLFAALDAGNLQNAWVFAGRGPGRAFGVSIFFHSTGAALRKDIRFAKLCVKLGLVAYWTTSGHWPDCATEVPYDFKAECEKAAREVATT